MKKRLLVPALAIAVTASLVATPAMAAQTPEEIDQSVATYEQLTQLVTDQVAQAYSGMVGTVEDLVAGTVRSTIGNPEAIIELAAPLIKAGAKGAIAQYIQDDRIDALIDSAVDSVAESELLNAVLTNEFTQAVIDRTIDYAVADIIASLGLDADQQATAESLVAQVWGAPLVSVGTAPTKVKSNLGSPIYALGVGVNTSYYNYNVTAWNQRRVVIVNINDTPKEIQVTGWNTGNIGLLASGTAYINAGSKADSVVTTLANLDYVSILVNAGTRALRDEITLRIEQALQAVKTTIVTSLQDSLNGIGVQVTLDPTAPWQQIGAQIDQALRDTAQAALDEALAGLPWVVTPGEPDESFHQTIARIARDGANYLLGRLRTINWLDLLRGGSGSSGGKDNAPTGPSLSLKVDRVAMANTAAPTLTIEARDVNGTVLPAADMGTVFSYSYGDSCQFPVGEAPSRRTCTITATYNGLTAKASIEVFDPSALAAPIDGQAIPGETLKASPPAGWPTISREWTRNGTKFSTATSYKLPSTEKLGNVIVLKQTMTYQGVTISGTSPALTVGTGSAASLKITPAVKAITNAGGVVLAAEAKDARGNVIPATAAGTTYAYSLGEGCSFPAGQAPSRRTCTITGTYDGVAATATVEVFDPSALAGAITGDAIPGAKLTAGGPEDWPTITRQWTRNGKNFSTASTYTLPKSEAVGNVIALTRTLKYQGLTISGTSPSVTVGLGAAASLKITPTAKAITNAGGVVLTAEAKDAFGNVLPAGVAGTAYTYSLGEGCSFPAGEAPSRRTCTITGTYGGVSATATVEVFDPSALAGLISGATEGAAKPGTTLQAVAPEGWPTVTRSWTRNGKAFATAASYKLPSTEKAGNVIELTQTLKYQGLTISGTSPAVVVAPK
ncbi:MAG: hypothetical protein LBK95_13905 [Bifidobacteriaceae bacterium]|jgi:hypothetical protein|nr:hypothetical protein [Bifidobacteriaceae bacterium]